MKISDKLREKLDALPDKPGCYIMRDRYGQIIYVGKALSLKKRVRSYFSPAVSRKAQPKLRGLIKSIADLDFVILKSESEAMIRESQLIKDYRPKYNVSFKDDKRFVLLGIDLKEPFPSFEIVRIKKNKTGTYFGPCSSSREARAALDYVEKTFGIRKCAPRVPTEADHKHCIDDVVRHCSAPCVGLTSRAEYAERVEKAVRFLSGADIQGLQLIRDKMHEAARSLDFEKAADYRDTLNMISKTAKRKSIVRQSPSGKKSEALAGIAELAGVAGLKKVPHVIETYDVSCISLNHAVASMVSAVDGVPCPNRYRRFQIKTAGHSDDASMMAEAVRRRFERLLAESRPMPDLVLVDGGIIQLRAAAAVLKKLNLTVDVMGLAKRYEDVYIEKGGRPVVIKLSRNSNALKVLQRIRDEAHRFAIAYHRNLRDKLIRESILDDIPGVGPVTKTKLLARFGSMTRIADASTAEIAATPGVGMKTAEIIKEAVTTNRS